MYIFPKRDAESAIMGRNGHDFIDSSFTPVSGRTYMWFRVRVDCSDISYTDANGQAHDNKSLTAGEEFDCSGAAPTIVGAGEIVAWVDQVP